MSVTHVLFIALRPQLVSRLCFSEAPPVVSFREPSTRGGQSLAHRHRRVTPLESSFQERPGGAREALGNLECQKHPWVSQGDPVLPMSLHGTSTTSARKRCLCLKETNKQTKTRKQQPPAFKTAERTVGLLG